MKIKYLLIMFLLFFSLPLLSEVRINFDMIVGVRMGPMDASVEGAAHFRADRVFVIEVEFPDGVVTERGTYSYDSGRGELLLDYKGRKGVIKYKVLSSNGRVKLLMVNKVAEAPPFTLELIYGSDD